MSAGSSIPWGGVERFAEQHIEIPANQADYVLGHPAGVGAAGGAAGDYLETLNLNVTDAANSAVSIKDGSGSAISVYPVTGKGAAGVVGVPIWIGISSRSGPWKITTGTGVTVEAVGTFK